jgi:two-component system LytT family response regulator
MTIRALIADDEPLARDRIRRLLADESDIEVVGESGDADSTVNEILRLKPDLLFLDVQMPGCDGFAVLKAVARHHLPCTVFVTAHDRYAVRAFEVNALDYLLKPFDRERFQEALRRVRQMLERGLDQEIGRHLRAFLDDRQKHPYVDRIVVKHAGRISFVRTDEIDWLEAAGNYIRLHVGSHEHLVRETMANFESKLDPARFVRIHRSTIVNIDRVRELETTFHGEYVVVLVTGTKLTLSRGYRARVEERLGTSL